MGITTVGNNFREQKLELLMCRNISYTADAKEHAISE